MHLSRWVSAWEGLSARGVSAQGVGASAQGRVCAQGGCVPRGCLPGGGVCPEGVSAQGGKVMFSQASVILFEGEGEVSARGMSARHPAVNRITDACENITLPQLRCGL